MYTRSTDVLLASDVLHVWPVDRRPCYIHTAVWCIFLLFDDHIQRPHAREKWPNRFGAAAAGAHIPESTGEMCTYDGAEELGAAKKWVSM